MSDTFPSGNQQEYGSGIADGPLLEALEAGLPLPEAPDPTPEGGDPSSPVGGGMFVFPHFESFVWRYNLWSRSYRWTYDEALKDSLENAKAFRRDPVVWEALRSRQRAVAGLEWHLEMPNDEDPAQIDHAKRVQDTILQTPALTQLLMTQCEAVWFGRSGSQCAFEWDYTAGYRRKRIRQHLPIHADKLVFRYSGEVGVLVSGNYKGSWIPTDRGRAHFCSAAEREQLIIHEFEPEDADYYDGDQAGRIHGVGLRDRLYWFLWLKQRVMAWLMQFLERVGAGGLTVYYYIAGDEASKNEVMAAASEQGNQNVIVFPRYRDKSGGTSVERMEPSMGGAALMQGLVTNYFDQVIRRAILGQTLSGEAAGTGLGSGVADFQAETLNEIVKYDAGLLQESLTRDLVRIISKYIDPRMPSPRWVFDVDKPNAAEFLQACQAFFEMGGSIGEDKLRSVLGIPKPKKGEAILSKVDPMSPDTMGQQPVGVPQIGAGGPDQGQDQGQDGSQPMQDMRQGAEGPEVNQPLPGVPAGQPGGLAGQQGQTGIPTLPVTLKRGGRRARYAA